jgi:hypothetical protein
MHQLAHTYNPSYSGSTDQEDQGLKPAQANSSARPYLKKIPNQKKKKKWAGGVFTCKAPA